MRRSILSVLVLAPWLVAGDGSGQRLTTELRGIEGVVQVTSAMIGDQEVLLVHVDNEAAADLVRERYGEGFEGMAVRVMQTGEPDRGHATLRTEAGPAPEHGVRMRFTTEQWWDMHTIVTERPPIRTCEPLRVEGFMTVTQGEHGAVQIALEIRRVTFWDDFGRWEIENSASTAEDRIDQIEQNARERLAGLSVPIQMAQTVPFIIARCDEEFLGLRIARAHLQTFAVEPADSADRVDRLFATWLQRLARLAGHGPDPEQDGAERVEREDGFEVKLRGDSVARDNPEFDAADLFAWDWVAADQPIAGGLALGLIEGGTANFEYSEADRRGTRRSRIEVWARNLPFAGAIPAGRIEGLINVNYRFEGEAERMR